jgi:phosphopantetheine adenylyltransferase
MGASKSALFGEIRPEGSLVSADRKEKAAAYYQKKKAEKAQQKAMALATGEKMPKEPKPLNNGNGLNGKPKSIVNRVTEYGALFNKLNEERVTRGLPPLKTAMEVLIDAMQSDELDIKDKAKIADKLAPFESSRAPIISIEHVQNIEKDEESSAEDALDDFLTALRKV